MELLNKFINNVEKKVLKISALDEDEITNISVHYSLCECVEMDLDALQYLALFTRVNTLILTGGIPTLEGLQCLYKQKKLRNIGVGL